MASARTLAFGLLGRTLGHSWSPQIHASLGSAPYALVEKEPADAESFLREGSWRGLNVTIPYKRLAADVADTKSERVERIGVANALVRMPDGSIHAENTDVLGFSWMLSRFCEQRLDEEARSALMDGEALVLGTGGAALAVKAAIEDTLGCPVALVSRKGNDSYEGISERHPRTTLIVNATPVGMYPDCPQSPVDDATLASFPQLRAVLDAVYNPERTGICLAAERLGIPSESGLAMLVAQAHFSSELFQGRSLDEGAIEQTEQRLRLSQRNIILIGMPGAGKTSTGRSLARSLHRPFIDLDDAFAVDAGMPAAQYISEKGEPAFRDRESKVTASYGCKSGLVIACGGGVVTRPENYDAIHQNGTICFIDRPLYQLSSEGRPVSQLKGIERLANERMGLYQSWADVHIVCTGSAAGDAQLIRAKLGL